MSDSGSPTSSAEDVCAKCGGDITIRVVVDPCDHQFCFACLHEWCLSGDEPEECPNCYLVMNIFDVEGEDQVYDFNEFKKLH